MTVFITVLHVLVCLLIIVVVLLQRGKGAEIGAVFGGGGGSTVFGSRGAGNFLTRLTAAAAAIFMVTSLTLAYFAHDDAIGTLLDDPPAASEAPSPFEETGAPTPEEAPAAGGFEELEAAPAPPAPEAGDSSAQEEPAATEPPGDS
jgi:preprotein translocase subunit SecG